MGWLGDRNVRKVAAETKQQRAYAAGLISDGKRAWRFAEPEGTGRTENGPGANAFALGYAGETASDQAARAKPGSRKWQLASTFAYTSMLDGLAYRVTPAGSTEEHRQLPDYRRGRATRRAEIAKRDSVGQR